MRPLGAHTVLPTLWLCVLLAVLVASGAGCGRGVEARQADVETALKAASAALVAHDPAAWKAALPAEGVSAQRAWQQVYAGLSRFRWATVFAEVVPVDPGNGRYGIRFHGRLAGSDGAPVVGKRLLEFATRKGRLTLVADRTTSWVRLFYYFSFKDPVVVVGKHLVVIGDRSQRRLISRVAACDEQADRVIADLHLDPASPEARRKTLVYVCRSYQDWAVSNQESDPGVIAYEYERQIYALAGGPGDWERNTPAYVRHELTHVYAGTFGVGEHYVTLPVEGLAMAVTGDRDYQGLRAEVASGNRTLPLMQSLSQEDVLEGLDQDTLDLAYAEGSALVLYLEQRWDLERAWVFADAVAASDMTPAGIREATLRSLGITWSDLYRGWKAYVRRLVSPHDTAGTH